ncbi:hypothetical protein HG536_0F00240 [Torulaspora globosa]|uniref:Uncharacterized protein n=1 Tax=Torulaspora globosa TaxID=48254 RepID=A0A7G3ZJL4_9SACH|nr:uncharacterized protein HG536_0F00240 [Torulaspora globosa]QLL33700.1 hypothetical protein HG536_0F00240 [Torulaspora globosa]
MGSAKKPSLRQRAKEMAPLQYAARAKRSLQGGIVNLYSRMSMLLFRRRSNLVLILLVVIGVLVGRSAMRENLTPSIGRSWQNVEVVERKPDLLHVDVSQLLKRKPLGRSPVTERMLRQEYTKEDITGFVSNLDVDKLVARKKKQADKDHAKIDAKLNLNDYRNLATCKDLAYLSSIYHSTEKVLLEDDLKTLRAKLRSEKNFLTNEIANEDAEKGLTENEIIQQKWFQFGTSAVWLEREQCYVAYSRVIYAPSGVRDEPHLSLVRAQAFDKDWKEIKGKRIPYVDMPIPKDMPEALKKIDKELGLSDCQEHRKDSSEYESCVVENAKNRLLAQNRKDKIMSKYYMTYPTVLNIPFNPWGDWRGPEDPKVILRKAKNYEEPVVMFNIWDDHLERRVMVAFMPHRKVDPLIKLKVMGREQRGAEKNWTPFFHRNSGESSVSRGFLHFIYSFSPLEILKCSLNDGFCEMVFEADTLRITEGNRFDGFRGGTQFVPLPDVLPQVRGQQIWIGFPKQHISDCGCGDRYYRPMFSVLAEHDGVYSQELLVPALGFNIDVISWDLKGTYCKAVNILSPNAIAHWDVVQQDPHSKIYEDYLTISVSEADINTRVVTIRGLLNYILNMYREKELQEKFEISEQADAIVGQTLQCLKASAFNYCKLYGEAHPEPKEDDQDDFPPDDFRPDDFQQDEESSSEKSPDDRDNDDNSEDRDDHRQDDASD